MVGGNNHMPSHRLYDWHTVASTPFISGIKKTEAIGIFSDISMV
jgi:hypothetical protein